MSQFQLLTQRVTRQASNWCEEHIWWLRVNTGRQLNGQFGLAKIRPTSALIPSHLVSHLVLLLTRVTRLPRRLGLG